MVLFLLLDLNGVLLMLINIVFVISFVLLLIVKIIFVYKLGIIKLFFGKFLLFVF